MPPWLLVALLISLLAGVGFQILLARPIRRVPIYWAVSFAGFLLGEAAADGANLQTPRLGELQIILDLIGVAVAIGALRLARL